MTGLLIVAGIAILVIGYSLWDVPNCTCGREDCGGGCLKRKR